MKREHMRAVTRFGSLSTKLERLADQTATVAAQRAAVVVTLCNEMTQREAARLLGISQQRVGQILAAYAECPKVTLAPAADQAEAVDRG